MMSFRASRPVSISIAVVLLALVGAQALEAQAAGAPKLEAPTCGLAVGKKAPLFSIPMSNGNEGVNLRRALERKKPVVVFFWEYFCAPCKKLLPELSRLAADEELQATVLLIHLGPDEAKMLSALHELGVSLPSASDDYSMKRESYCVNATPRTVVVAPNGIVSAVIDGFSDDYVGSVRKAVAASR